MGKALVGTLRKGLKKTRERLGSGIVRILTGRGKIDEELLEDLEATFLQTDMGVEMSLRLVETVRELFRSEKGLDKEYPEKWARVQELLPFVDECCKTMEDYYNAGNYVASNYWGLRRDEAYKEIIEILLEMLGF